MRSTDKSSADHGMNYAQQQMQLFFGTDVKLVSSYGPESMGCYALEYAYRPKNYRIRVDCERGIISIYVTDANGGRFWPSMIYPEAKYYHMEEKESDIRQLVELTHKAIAEGTIRFEK